MVRTRAPLRPLEHMMRKVRILLVAACVMTLSINVHAVNVLKANTEFKNRNYEAALPLYIESAELGNAHAQYQLGMMYAKGLGVETNMVSALVYFSLAAHDDYHNAAALMESILTSFTENELSLIIQVIDEVKREQNQHQRQYLPEIDSNTLDFRVTFEGNDSLNSRIYYEELSDFQNFENETSELEDTDISDLTLFISNPGFLIVENDVARDGSVRYAHEIQKFGNTKRYLDAYKLFPLSTPDFKGKPAEFIHRAFLGAAISDQFTLHKKLPTLYQETRRILRRVKENPTLEAQYQYAMAMVVFPWMQNEESNAETLLKHLAIKGHPAAMYEYGIQLYLQQKEIPEAIRWITKASTFGLSRAEYRLGKLLLASPWVVEDEGKALFWFESAMQKGNDAAALHAAKIKLTAKNTALLDVEGAIRRLNTVADSQSLNPEYFYLLSLSYRLRTDRDFKRAVEELERAIMMARRNNWDTSEWEVLLAKMLEGKITVTDF